MLEGDNLHICYRCNNVDTIDDICSFCKEELRAHHDYEIGWREAWEQEQVKKMHWEIEKDPQWIYRQLDTFERLGREWSHHPEMSAAVAADKAKFEERWARARLFTRP